MNYITQNKKFMNILKCKMADQDNPALCYTYFKRAFYLDDYHNFIVTSYDLCNIKKGYGNTMADVLVVTSSCNPDEIKTIRELLNRVEVGFNNAYITCYNKSNEVEDEILTDYINEELNVVKPKIIIFSEDIEKDFDYTPNKECVKVYPLSKLEISSLNKKHFEL